jgi:CBS domain-containing protein
MMIKAILKNKGEAVITVSAFESVRDAMRMMVEHKIAALVLTNSTRLPLWC